MEGRRLKPQIILSHLRRAARLAPLLVVWSTAAVASAETVQDADQDAEKPAVDLNIVYTADLWSSLRGGQERGSRYLDNLDVTLAVDGERALGWTGTSLFLYGLYNNGTGLSDRLAGDFQGLSNIETDVRAARLYEAWIEQALHGGKASLRAGLYNLNSEFDALETSTLFINNAFGIGAGLSQTGRNGPSSFPVTSLALRGALRLSDRMTVRAAVLDGVPGDPAHPARTVIKLGHGDGALLAGEADYNHGAFRAVAGYWRYTAAFPDQRTGLPRRGNDGLYGFVEGAVGGLSLFLRGGWASASINPVARYMAAGTTRKGPFPSRPEDELGLGVAIAQSGRPYRAAVTADRRETAIELTYRAVVRDFLILQPDLQYILNPGLNPSLRNVFAVGLRLELAWGMAR